MPIIFPRAVLARWRRPAPAPAEGEVAKLVADLRMMASQAAEACQFTDAENLSRAADLLEQRHPAPVPVNERLPGPLSAMPLSSLSSLVSWRSAMPDLPPHATLNPMTDSLPWSTEPSVSGRYLCLRDGIFTLYDIDYYSDPQMGIFQWDATEVCSGTRAGWSVASLQPAYWLLVSALPLPVGEEK